jgi:hypothetical protein
MIAPGRQVSSYGQRLSGEGIMVLLPTHAGLPMLAVVFFQSLASH